MKISRLLGFLGICGCATRPTPPDGELTARLAAARQPSILFVGNSYSFGLPRAFKQIAAENGKSVRVGHSTYGGWTLSQHASHPATLRKIREGRWDVVVLQEQSQTPALPPGRRDRLMLPAVRQLAAEARKSGAIPVLFQTWGRRDGDAAVKGDTFHLMNRRLREGYQAAAAAAGGLRIAPAGDAWEAEVSAGRGNVLFLDDGSHPSARGNALNARAFYEEFFGD